MAILASSNFLFVTGIEGSGTTMMLKLLNALDEVAVLGGNYWSPSLAELAGRLNSLTEALWGPELVGRPSDREAIVDQIRALEIPAGYTHVVHKRSFPFLDSQHVPVLEEARSFAEQCGLLVMRRMLDANTRSILRRGFERETVKAQQRTYMAHAHLERQLAKLDTPWMEIAYEDIIDTAKKPVILSNLALRFALDQQAVLAQAELITGPTFNPHENPDLA